MIVHYNIGIKMEPLSFEEADGVDDNRPLLWSQILQPRQRSPCDKICRAFIAKVGKASAKGWLHSCVLEVRTGGRTDDGAEPRAIESDDGAEPRAIEADDGAEPRAIETNNKTKPHTIEADDGAEPRAIRGWGRRIRRRGIRPGGGRGGRGRVCRRGAWGCWRCSSAQRRLSAAPAPCPTARGRRTR